MDLIIDQEFKSLIQPLRTEELAQLEENLKEDGCRDALVVWRGILLDGHNRYEICTRNGIAFRTSDIVLNNREEAINWIIDNQLGRRNLTPEQQSYLRGKRYNQEKKEWGGERGNQYEKVASGHFGHLPKTRDSFSEQFKVSPNTIRRDANFAEAVDRIAENTGPEVRQQILSREAALPKSTVIDIAALEPDEQRRIISLADKKTILEAAKEIRQEQKEKIKQAHQEKRTRQLPLGKYAVIYADPPWQYSNSGLESSAENQYPTMPIEDICALPISDLASSTSVLFLWATNPLLPDALRVVSAWGFEYKTNIVWVKGTGQGIGWYTKSAHEILIIATRKETPHPNLRPTSYFEERRTGHSKKPECVYEMIEDMYPGNKIELFAREQRKGWENWGNEDL